MPHRIDVVVRTGSLSSFRALLSSVDRQPVEATEFAVICVPDGLDQADRERLEALTGYRPNLQVLDPGASWWSTGLTAVQAGHVLPLEDSDHLVDGALPRMLEAARSGADVVLGRAVVAGRTTSWNLFADVALEGAVLHSADPDGLALVVSREVAASTSDHTDLGDIRGNALAAVGRAHVLGGQPLIHRRAGSGTHIDPPVVPGTASWSEGVLQVSASGLDPLDPVREVVARHRDNDVDWLLEHSSPSPDTCSVRLDPHRAAAGSVLDSGRWVVDLIQESGVIRRVAVESVPGSALLGGLLVSGVKGRQGRLVLDVGATKRSPLGGLDPATAVIHESAQGTRLVWPVPFADVTGADRVAPARLRLGNFPVMAQLSVTDGRATLQAWLSGVPSRVPVSASLAGSPWHPTGSDLQIDLAGEMRLVRSEPKQHSAPSPTASTSSNTARALAGRVARKLRAMRR